MTPSVFVICLCLNISPGTRKHSGLTAHIKTYYVTENLVLCFGGACTCATLYQTDAQHTCFV